MSGRVTPHGHERINAIILIDLKNADVREKVILTR